MAVEKKVEIKFRFRNASGEARRGKKVASFSSVSRLSSAGTKGMREDFCYHSQQEVGVGPAKRTKTKEAKERKGQERGRQGWLNIGRMR